MPTELGTVLALEDPAETKAAKAPALVQICPTQDTDKKQVSREGHTRRRAIGVRRDSKQGHGMESARAAGGEGLSEEVAFELRCECKYLGVPGRGTPRAKALR